MLCSKVEQVVEEVDAIRRTLDKYGTREERRAAELADREELLARAQQGRRVRSEMDEEAQVRAALAACYDGADQQQRAY